MITYMVQSNSLWTARCCHKFHLFGMKLKHVWFLSKVLLSTSMFCSICDFGMSWKWHTQENSMCASNSVETFGTLKVTFRQQTEGRTQFLGGYLKKWYDLCWRWMPRKSVSEWKKWLWNLTNMYQDIFLYQWNTKHSHFESSQLSNCWCSVIIKKVPMHIIDVSHVKPLLKDCMVEMKMQIKLRNLFFKTKDSLCLKLLTCWKFHWEQFRAFWSRIWTCVTFLRNMCPMFWEESRRKVMSACTRTLNKGMKKPHNFCQK